MMHQLVDPDPASDVGTYRFLSGKIGIYHLFTMRAWEKAGIARQVTFNTWEQVEPTFEFQRNEIFQNVLIRLGNNTAHEIIQRAKFILRSHPQVAERIIFEICMKVCKKEHTRLKEVLGNIPFVTDQCDT
jgi:hypothetical protein